MEFTRNMDEELVVYPNEGEFEALVQHLQKGENVKLSPRPSRVSPRVEGVSLTLEEFKKAKAERLEAYVRKEEKRREQNGKD